MPSDKPVDKQLMQNIDDIENHIDVEVNLAFPIHQVLALERLQLNYALYFKDQDIIEEE